MTNAQIKNGFNEVIKNAKAAGADADFIARAELAREFYSNPEFRAALTAEVAKNIPR